MSLFPLGIVVGTILLLTKDAWGDEYPSPVSTTPKPTTSPKQKGSGGTMGKYSGGTFTRDMVDWGNFVDGKPTIALVVGHSKQSGGAEGVFEGKRYSEYDVMPSLAKKIRYLMPDGINTPIFLRQKLNEYNSENRFLDQLKPDLIFRLHMNQANPKTSGVEVLYWVNSVKGQEIATELSKGISVALGIKNRGAKPLKYGDRASHLLYDVKSVCIIGENGFIPYDFSTFFKNIDKVAGVYATIGYQCLKEKING